MALAGWGMVSQETKWRIPARAIRACAPSAKIAWTTTAKVFIADVLVHCDDELQHVRFRDNADEFGSFQHWETADLLVHHGARSFCD